MIRNSYNAITNWPAWAKGLANQAESIGAFATGIQSDRRQRGTAVNVDLYGYDESAGLIVVQVRQAVFHPRRYTEVRKNYLLIGTNEETGAIFAHPVDSPARSKKALVSPESTIEWVLCKIWGCKPPELAEIRRQGDVAFIPVKRLPDGATPITGPVKIRETHLLKPGRGGQVFASGSQYFVVRSGKLVHTKGQHAPVVAKEGIFRVQPGFRAKLWDFSQQRGD